MHIYSVSPHRTRTSYRVDAELASVRVGDHARHARTSLGEDVCVNLVTSLSDLHPCQVSDLAKEACGCAWLEAQQELMQAHAMTLIDPACNV